LLGDRTSGDGRIVCPEELFLSRVMRRTRDEIGGHDAVDKFDVAPYSA